MDNQHKLITGYRDLTEKEIAAMNRIKDAATSIGNMMDELADMEGIDQRWLAIGKTDLQKGFMSVVRSIAKPTTF
jgi:hypothetical protein